MSLCEEITAEVAGERCDFTTWEQTQFRANDSNRHRLVEITDIIICNFEKSLPIAFFSNFFFPVPRRQLAVGGKLTAVAHATRECAAIKMQLT